MRSKSGGSIFIMKLVQEIDKTGAIQDPNVLICQLLTSLICFKKLYTEPEIYSTKALDSGDVLHQIHLEIYNLLENILSSKILPCKLKAWLG